MDAANRHRRCTSLYRASDSDFVLEDEHGAVEKPRRYSAEAQALYRPHVYSDGTLNLPSNYNLDIFHPQPFLRPGALGHPTSHWNQMMGTQYSYDPSHPYPLPFASSLDFPSPVDSTADFSDRSSSTTGGMDQSPRASLAGLSSPFEQPYCHPHHARHTSDVDARGSTYVNLQQVQHFTDYSEKDHSTAITPSLTPVPHTDIAPYAVPLDPEICDHHHHRSSSTQQIPSQPAMQSYLGLDQYQPQGPDSAIGSSMADEEDAEGEIDHEDDAQEMDFGRESDGDFNPNARGRRATGRPGRNRRISNAMGEPRRLNGAPARQRRPSTRTRVVKSSSGHRTRGSLDADMAIKCPEHPHLVFTNKKDLKKHKTSCAKPRPFPCLLRPLCHSAFGSKNEWKRHIATQHLLLGYFRCADCEPKAASASSPPSPSATRTSHNDFNRKDLFTQHIRRMHPPPLAPTSQPPTSAYHHHHHHHHQQAPTSPSGNGSTTNIEWETTTLPQIHASSWTQVRSAPQRVSCTCSRVFDGPQAWENRVECLGRHFEGGKVLELQDGSAENDGMDVELVAWMANEGLLVRHEETGRWAYGSGERDAEGDDE